MRTPRVRSLAVAAALVGMALLALAVGQARRTPVARAPAGTANPSERGQPTRTPTRVRGTAIGQEAPELTLPDLQGQAVRLDDLRGQVVLLNFWASWCGPCRMEVPELVAVHERLRESGFTVVAVNLGEPRARVQAFADEYGMSFPVLVDEGAASARIFPSRGLPASFILDREGIVRKVVVGAMDEKMMAALIEPLL